jgi:hypothetical protein
MHTGSIFQIAEITPVCISRSSTIFLKIALPFVFFSFGIWLDESAFFILNANVRYIVPCISCKALVLEFQVEHIFLRCTPRKTSGISNGSCSQGKLYFEHRTDNCDGIDFVHTKILHSIPITRYNITIAVRVHRSTMHTSTHNSQRCSKCIVFRVPPLFVHTIRFFQNTMIIKYYDRSMRGFHEHAVQSLSITFDSSEKMRWTLKDYLFVPMNVIKIILEPCIIFIIV